MLRYVEISMLSRRYEEGFELKEISLGLEKGEVYTLMGPSGSGKTSLLRNICGLDKPQKGRIIVDGRDVTSVPTTHRGIGLIFQDLALFPHMTVFENIAYGLRALRWERGNVTRRVNDLASLLHIQELLDRYPSQVSGGQRQRIALARSVAPSPSLLLLDEPLSSLDQQLRADVRSELKYFAKEIGLTMIYVTHDHHEGLYMADTAGVMFDGVLERQGRPQELFTHPGTSRVARFFGYNVVTLDGSKVCFFPSDAKPVASGGDLSGVVRSVGYEGEFYRAQLLTDAGEAVQITYLSSESAGRLNPGERTGLRIGRAERLE